MSVIQVTLKVNCLVDASGMANGPYEEDGSTTISATLVLNPLSPPDIAWCVYACLPVPYSCCHPVSGRKSNSGV